MADPSEQPETVLQAIIAGVHSKQSWFQILPSIGLDVDLPVARLLEDLSIAARVRACPDTYPFDPASVSEDYLDGWDALLGWLLNGDTP